MPIGTVFDLFVIVLMLISAGVAFFRGFIRELLTIVGVVGGLIAALFLAPPLVPVVRGWYGIAEAADATAEADKLFGLIPMSIVADATTYGGVFLVVVILLQLISYFLSGIVKASGLGPVDRTLGIFFGLARGVILLGILYLPLHLILSDQQKEEFFAESKLNFYVAETSAYLASFLPSDDDDENKERGEKARDMLKDIDVLDSEKAKEGFKNMIDKAPSLEVAPMPEPDKPGYGTEEPVNP